MRPVPLVPALVLACLASVASVAGCLGAGVAPPEASVAPRALGFGEPVVVFASCENFFDFCFEPSVAADAEGRLFASNAVGGSLAASSDGGASWTPFADPPLPPQPAAMQSDVLLQVGPDGRLYYSALVIAATSVLSGVQVAVSEDGGATWASNAFLNAPETNPSFGADRQWLAFGEDGVVYAAYHQISASPARGFFADPVWTNDLRVARSDDGGRTWGDFVVATPPGRYIGGMPVVDAGGRFLYPAFSYGPSSNRLEVVASADGGRTFERLPVFEPEDGLAGDYFPSLVAFPSGALALAWKDGHGALRAARSTDGGVSWSAPATWSAEGEAVTSSPWALARADGGMDVAYYVEDDGGATLALASVDASGGVVARSVVARVEGANEARHANTDFAHVVHAGDRLVAVVVDAGAGLLAVASR